MLRRLTSQQILSLVHQAHSRGLLTYFTGGVTCKDIQPAVAGGVDGVGVGGVGMLHHADTGRNPADRHGPYMEENIPQVCGELRACVYVCECVRARARACVCMCVAEERERER